MNEKVLVYKKRLESQLRGVEAEIALKERSKSRLLEKLKDVESSFNRELRKGAVKVSKIAGVEPVKKTKTVLKKNSGGDDKLEIPTVEMELSPPAPAPAKEKKSSWSLSPFG